MPCIPDPSPRPRPAHKPIRLHVLPRMYPLTLVSTFPYVREYMSHKGMGAFSVDLFLCGSDLILVFVAVDCFPKSSENIVSDRFDGWLVTLSNVSHLVIVTCWALSVLGYVCVWVCVHALPCFLVKWSLWYCVCGSCVCVFWVHSTSYVCRRHVQIWGLSRVAWS